MSAAAGTEPGYTLQMVNRVVWKYPSHFSDFSPLGTGSYGTVCSAIDGRTGQRVAIKKLLKPFQTEVHAKRALRELKLLRYMQHDNIIGLLDAFCTTPPAGPVQEAPDFDVYLVTELMGADFRTMLRTQQVSDEHAQFLIYQILRGLKYTHSAGIIHRDLSPGNIAVNEDCDVKILDFGLARTATQEVGKLTGYVQKKWYRAPEVMLNWRNYGEKVDMWSVGCILAELLIGRPLFPAKTNHVEHLNMIVKLLGTPSEEYIANISSDHIQKYLRSLPRVERPDLAAYFRRIRPDVNPAGVDLCQRLLEYNPGKRLSPADALEHEYVVRYHLPDDEPTAATPFDDRFEEAELSIKEWKDLVWAEVQSYLKAQFQAAQQQLVAQTARSEQRAEEQAAALRVLQHREQEQGHLQQAATLQAAAVGHPDAVVAIGGLADPAVLHGQAALHVEQAQAHLAQAQALEQEYMHAKATQLLMQSQLEAGAAAAASLPAMSSDDALAASAGAVAPDGLSAMDLS